MTPTRDAPGVSVLLATADPGDALARALRSVLANDGPPFEVRIVDASPTPSAVALGEPWNDPRIRWTRRPGSCSAAAHNAAIAVAGGEILAITDEDCEVASTWIGEMVRAFERDPRVGVVFGRVEPGFPDDPFVPAYLVEEECVARNPSDAPCVAGIWACLGVRKRTWQRLGGFDERFGRGARFPGSADLDFALRALAAGEHVVETPRVRVRSHRRLSPAEYRRAIRGYTYASGALLGVHLRRRMPGVLGRAVSLARRGAAGRVHGALGTAAPHPLRRLGVFLAGAGAGFLSRRGDRVRSAEGS